MWLGQSKRRGSFILRTILVMNQSLLSFTIGSFVGSLCTASIGMLLLRSKTTFDFILGHKRLPSIVTDINSDKVKELESLLIQHGASYLNPTVSPHNWIHCTNSTPDRRIQRRYFLLSNTHLPRIIAIVRFGIDTEGPPGCVHGGASASVIDSVCGAAARHATGPSYTANLNINYKRRIPTDSVVVVDAAVCGIEGRKVTVAFHVMGPSEWLDRIHTVRQTDRHGAITTPPPPSPAMSHKDPQAQSLFQFGTALFVRA